MIIRRLPTFPSWSSAFRELSDVRREMERLFDSLADSTGLSGAGVFPAINVSETDEAVLVQAELPGVDPQKLQITVENNNLMLGGERDTTVAGKDVSYHRREREWGSFRRSFSLPVRIDSSRVQARYDDGVLTVELPKSTDARPRQISVQAGA